MITIVVTVRAFSALVLVIALATAFPKFSNIRWLRLVSGILLCISAISHSLILAQGIVPVTLTSLLFILFAMVQFAIYDNMKPK